MPIDSKAEKRFWAKVDKRSDDECWNWLSATTATRGSKMLPYGSFTVDNKPRRAHRISFELAYKCDPGNLIVMHLCDNPRCVNPKHLCLGTIPENNADRDAKNRHVPNVGEQNPRSKFTEQDVRDIRAARNAGERQKDVAQRYGVSVYAIYYIERRLGWKNL